MKSKKLNEDLKNTSIGKISQDNCDKMIRQLLKDEVVVKSFINASIKDGISMSEIKSQLKYFGVKALLN